MKKGLLGILLICIAIVFVTGCGNGFSLSKLADKFNESDLVKDYKEVGSTLVAEANGNTLTVKLTGEGFEPISLDYTLDGDILSGTFDLTGDKGIYASIISVYLIDIVEQFQGYEPEETLLSLSDKRVLNYTLDKEGLHFVLDEKTFKFEIDTSKKVPLLDFSNVYITTEDLQELKSYINDGGAFANAGYIQLRTTKDGNTITLYIVEKNNNTSNSYNTLASVFEVLYGAKGKKFLEKNYASIEEGSKEFKGVKVVVDYTLTEEDGDFELPSKDSKVMKVTINTKTVKAAVKKVK